MSISDRFSLPYQGMKDGLHQYQFEADDDFFAEFENSPIKNGFFKIDVNIDKRTNLSELNIEIDGYYSTICDRCLADIKLPVKGSYDLLIKVSDTETDNDEVIFIKEDESKLLLAQIFFEYICLSMPWINVYECENENPAPCNTEILKKLNETSGKMDESKTDDNIWEGLKGIQLDN
ncbi:MAG: DUF177 domain-containing protein [Saprospiraceae bacterium]|nr:DUF177 domain-containing protein [Saprospiraceae bacterium]MBL0101989.1 DUF177 domain-containing protein [Saprospiraceae bacterium]